MIKPGRVVTAFILILLGCEKTPDHSQAETNSVPASLPVPVSEPVVVAVATVPEQMAKITRIEKRVDAVKEKWLDTSIPSDILKDSSLFVNMERQEAEITLEPVSLRPPNKTQFMVTPQFFLKEENQPKESYLDYLDGAAVKVEVKFD